MGDAMGDANDSAGGNANDRGDHANSSGCPEAPEDAYPSSAVVSDEECERMKARSRRQVMPFAEYVAHVRSLPTNDSVHQSSPTIHVPLFPGETEEEYELAFRATLTEQQRKKVDQSAKMGGARVSFALQRAEWFGKDEGELAMAVTAQDLEDKTADELPRAALCAVKYVKRWLYELQVSSKFFENVKETPLSTIYQWYGTAIVPIYMPLELHETREQCEERFTQWLQETNSMKPGELLSDKSPSEERRLRIAFAATAMDDENSVKMFWRRRVLPLIEYAAEYEKQAKLRVDKGVTTSSKLQPIPVPLFPGETEQEYEKAFFTTVPVYQRTEYYLPTPPRHLRGMQFFFANARAQWFARSEGATELHMDDVNNRCVKDLPQAGLCVVQHLTKFLYKIQVRSGFYNNLQKMSRSETYAAFGTVLPPVYMPREENETVEQCEARFQKWRAMYAFATVEKPTDLLDERMCRIDFAKKAGLTPTSKKRKRNLEMIAPNVMKSASQWEIKKCRICGCQKCNAEAAGLVKRTLLSQSSAPEIVTRAATNQQSISDVEAKLFIDYQVINHKVVMNEKVLEDLEAQVVSASMTDIRETVLVMEENEEFRRLIEDEIDERNASLALLVVCMWRNDLNELKRMVSDPSATNVPYIHRASHRKCDQLSTKIKEKQSRADSQTAQLESVSEDIEQLKKQLSAADGELRQLHDQLRREFLRLLRFDERVRLLVQELLAVRSYAIHLDVEANNLEKRF